MKSNKQEPDSIFKAAQPGEAVERLHELDSKNRKEFEDRMGTTIEVGDVLQTDGQSFYIVIDIRILDLLYKSEVRRYSVSSLLNGTEMVVIDPLIYDKNNSTASNYIFYTQSDIPLGIDFKQYMTWSDLVYHNFKIGNVTKVIKQNQFVLKESSENIFKPATKVDTAARVKEWGDKHRAASVVAKKEFETKWGKLEVEDILHTQKITKEQLRQSVTSSSLDKPSQKYFKVTDIHTSDDYDLAELLSDGFWVPGMDLVGFIEVKKRTNNTFADLKYVGDFDMFDMTYIEILEGTNPYGQVLGTILEVIRGAKITEAVSYNDAKAIKDRYAKMLPPSHPGVSIYKTLPDNDGHRILGRTAGKDSPVSSRIELSLDAHHDPKSFEFTMAHEAAHAMFEDDVDMVVNDVTKYGDKYLDQLPVNAYIQRTLYHFWEALGISAVTAYGSNHRGPGDLLDDYIYFEENLSEAFALLRTGGDKLDKAMSVNPKAMSIAKEYFNLKHTLNNK